MKNSLSIVRLISRIAGSSLLIWALAACNAQTDTNSVEPSNNRAISTKIDLDVATYEQVAEHVFQCQGKKICVTICHRPPGNPENSKTRTLPLQATAAHLNHGGSHTEKDYLGACQTGEPGEGTDGTDDPTDGTDDPTDGTDDPTDGTDDGTEDPPTEIPAWCLPNIDIDSDCDGIHDIDGTSMF